MLAPQNIKPLVEKIVDSFDEVSFESFLVTDFEGVGLDDYAPSGLAWPIRAVAFVKQLIARDRDLDFLKTIANHQGPTSLFPGPKTPLRELAAGLLMAALPPPPTLRPCFLNGRHFINRDSLWRQVGALSQSQGAQRVLLVDGETGTGKTHSALLVSQSSRNHARYIPIDLAKSTAPEASIEELVGPIATRLEIALKQRFDDLSQEARNVLRAGERLVAALQEVERVSPESWWILVDGLNMPRVGAAIVDLVVRLAQAIDQGECNNVCLILIGLKPERLTGTLPSFVRVNHTTLPDPADVKEWMLRLGAEHDLAAPDLTRALDAVMRVMTARNLPAPLFWSTLLAEIDRVRVQLGLVS